MNIQVNVPTILANALASWKTTLAGLAALVIATFQALNEPSFMAALHDQKFQTMIILGLLGVLAKDANVTGGTVPQTSEAQKRLAA